MNRQMTGILDIATFHPPISPLKCHFPHLGAESDDFFYFPALVNIVSLSAPSPITFPAEFLLEENFSRHRDIGNKIVPCYLQT